MTLPREDVGMVSSTTMQLSREFVGGLGVSYDLVAEVIEMSIRTRIFTQLRRDRQGDLGRVSDPGGAGRKMT